MEAQEKVVAILKSGLFNLKELAAQSKISRRTLVSLKHNDEHKANHSTIDSLANFIKKLGE